MIRISLEGVLSKTNITFDFGCFISSRLAHYENIRFIPYLDGL
jgi:hypothetical protein